MNSIPETPHAYVPPTITDKNGDVWTYRSSPFEGRFAREYVMGKRTATLMAYASGGPRKLISTSGKLLATVRDEEAALPLVDGAGRSHSVRYSTDGGQP